MSRPPLPGRLARGPVLGADGCKRGAWVSVELSLDRGRPTGMTGRVAPDVETLLEGTAARVVALDVPIGLPDAPERGGRAAERAARARLGARASTVFSTPCRPAVALAAELGFAAEAYRPVCDLNAAASEGGSRLSKQAFFLLPRIHAVDARLRRSRPDRERVLETHPELAFLNLADGAPLPPKKTAEGRRARIELLATVGLDPAPVLGLDADPRVAPDDVLDAVACAWVAARRARGEAKRLPEGPLPRDGAGLPMALWF